MKYVITKIAMLSFIVLSAACSDKEVTEPPKKQEEVSQDKGDKKSPQVRFKATEPRDKSTYKNPTF